jgi:hypothetical protein
MGLLDSTCTAPTGALLEHEVDEDEVAVQHRQLVRRLEDVPQRRVEQR